VANTKQSKKRVRQSEKHRLHNVALRSMYRSAIKKVMLAIEKGGKEEATAAYKEAMPIVDKMVPKRIIHKNKAARHKSRLSLLIKKMG
jgi:small subunit ribosomal protein S20